MNSAWEKSKKRSHLCGTVDLNLEGQSITLNGWVKGLRDHGHLLFVDLCDESGCIQITFDSTDPQWKHTKQFHYDWVLSVHGQVKKRPENMQNKNLETGSIEIIPQKVLVLSSGKTAPFRKGDTVNESLALSYRYLDFRRRPDLKHNLKVRHNVLQIIRKELSQQNFYEIETPILYKSTPEGARDYLVPSRNQTGSFYALPQSPQTLKQLLMIGSWEKYFQIARCFRDEDLRSNRQPEFTQLDLEISFTDEEEIKALTEHLIKSIWSSIKKEHITKFPSLSYQEAMKRFGTDKPDLRNPLELKVIDSERIKKSGLKILLPALNDGFTAKPFLSPNSPFLEVKLMNYKKQYNLWGRKLIMDTKKGKGIQITSKKMDNR